MNTTYTYLDSLVSQIPEISPDSIISRTVFDDEQVKVVLFGFAAGQSLSEHTASQAAALHFLQGEADLTLGDNAVSVQAGAWIHMPPRLSHSVYAKTPVIMQLLLFKEG